MLDEFDEPAAANESDEQVARVWSHAALQLMLMTDQQATATKRFLRAETLDDASLADSPERVQRITERFIQVINRAEADGAEQ